jgi:hypothetical protein
MIENKKGRKYDREKWGWKNESELKNFQSIIDDFESDRKLKTEKFATQVIGICIVVMLTLIVLSFIL